MFQLRLYVCDNGSFTILSHISLSKYTIPNISIRSQELKREVAVAKISGLEKVHYIFFFFVSTYSCVFSTMKNSAGL